MKEFFVLKFGIIIMDEYEKRLFELLKYVDFRKDEGALRAWLQRRRGMSGKPMMRMMMNGDAGEVKVHRYADM
jgi:hypothetical protein